VSLVAAACTLAAFVIPVVPGTAKADVLYTFVTPANSSTAGGPVQDQVAFVVGTGVNVPVGTIQVTLTNQQSNPNDVSQLLSDLSFTVSNGSTSGATLASSSGRELTVNGGGSFSTGLTVPTGWVLSVTGGGTGIHLDDLSGPGHAGPAHLIIGPPDGGGTYGNANGSITGNGPHNPFLNQTASFTITGAGITANTQVTDASFSFGTTSGVIIPGVTAVPEPGALVMGGLTAAAFALVSGARRAAAARRKG
jgi:hypothetical protein